jgi:hypothetical protein
MTSKVQSLFIIKTHSKKLSGKNCYEKEICCFKQQKSKLVFFKIKRL